MDQQRLGIVCAVGITKSEWLPRGRHKRLQFGGGGVFRSYCRLLHTMDRNLSAPALRCRRCRQCIGSWRRPVAPVPRQCLPNHAPMRLSLARFRAPHRDHQTHRCMAHRLNRLCVQYKPGVVREANDAAALVYCRILKIT